jgi:hypothetical protein
VPSGNDLANYSANNFDRIKLAEWLTGVDGVTLRQMHANDFRAIMGVVAGFLA